jgi:hypothetical protein
VVLVSWIDEVLDTAVGVQPQDGTPKPHYVVQARTSFKVSNRIADRLRVRHDSEECNGCGSAEVRRHAVWPGVV